MECKAVKRKTDRNLVVKAAFQVLFAERESTMRSAFLVVAVHMSAIRFKTIFLANNFLCV